MIARSSSHQLSPHLNFPHSEIMETRASKHASDAETPPPALSLSEHQTQKSSGPFSSPKFEVSTPPIKSEFPQLMLSAEELSVVISMRSPPTTEPTSVPSLPSILQDLKRFLKSISISWNHRHRPIPLHRQLLQQLLHLLRQRKKRKPYRSKPANRNSMFSQRISSLSHPRSTNRSGRSLTAFSR